MIDTYLIHLAIMIGIYIILALSLQLSMGFGGLLNLGHIAFFAIGAYTSALLCMASVSYIYCMIAAIILPSIFGYLLSLATNKLKGDYLALTTLGFSLVISALAMNWSGLTRGSLGIAGIPKPTLFSIKIESNSDYLIFILIFAAITYTTIKLITISPFGKALAATRDDETAAMSLGKNTFLIKSTSLMISALFAGLAGSLFTHYIAFIDPGTFSFSSLIPILVIVTLGGLGSLEGTIFATVIIILMPEAIRLIGLPSSIIGPVRLMIYSALLLIIILFQPKGFDGKVELE